MKQLFIALFLVSSFQTFAQQDFKLQQDKNVPYVKNINSVSEEIQPRLYNLIALYHNVQQAHWNLRGPQFQSLHKLLGEFYGDLGAKIDLLAERNLALGKPSDGRPDAVAANAGIPAAPTGFQKDHDVIKTLTPQVLTVSNNLGKSIDAVGSDDVVTQDLLIDIRATIDLYLWKLRSFSYN